MIALGAPTHRPRDAVKGVAATAYRLHFNEADKVGFRMAKRYLNQYVPVLQTVSTKPPADAQVKLEKAATAAISAALLLGP
jgi:hypothetical protein